MTQNDTTQKQREEVQQLQHSLRDYRGDRAKSLLKVIGLTALPPAIVFCAGFYGVSQFESKTLGALVLCGAGAGLAGLAWVSGKARDYFESIRQNVSDIGYYSERVKFFKEKLKKLPKSD